MIPQEELDELKGMLFSEDESNFDLAMQVLRGLDVDRWGVYSDLRKATEYLALQWGLRAEMKTILRELRRREFNLSAGQLNYLPDALGVLAPIVRKAILARNQFTQVPAPVLQFDNMEVLQMEYNKLTELPDGLWALRALAELQVLGNRILELSAGISKARQLQNINVAGLHMTTIPATLAELPRLQKMTWGSHEPETAPQKSIQQSLENIGACRGLLELGLYLDDFDQMRGAAGLWRLPSLRTLRFNLYGGGEMSADIGKLKGLEVLHIVSNNGGDPIKLPRSLAQLPRLRSVVFNARVRELPSVFYDMPQLEQLVLHAEAGYPEERHELLRSNHKLEIAVLPIDRFR